MATYISSTKNKTKISSKTSKKKTRKKYHPKKKLAKSNKLKSSLVSPSSEQLAIIKAIKNGNNVICDAVAGSGKTTTILWLAKKLPSMKIIQITYNKQLKIEVREKVKQNQINNVEIHTYHSLAVKYYNRSAHEDSKMRNIITTNTKPIHKIPNFNIIVLDETQDMTLLYYRMISKFICDHSANNISTKLIILTLGDKYQGIYQFKNADTRFLTLTPELWPHFTPMVKLSLKTSYRVTKPIAWFVNEVMLGEQRIISNKPGYAITYIRDNIFKAHEKIIPKLLDLLNKKLIKPDDIFVLAPSVRSEKAPIRAFENELVLNNIECFVPTSDDSKLDEKVMKGKVIFTTFHQAKGRERKVVIVYGFDDSYFKYFEKTSSRNICPSAIYVAVTRCSERLFILENENSSPFEFLKKTHTELMKTKRIKFIGSPKINDTESTVVIKKLNNTNHQTSPRELVRFLKDETLNIIEPIINDIFYVEHSGESIINIPSKIKSTTNKYEDVSDLNGLVIPAMFEASQKNGKNSLVDFIEWEKDYADNFLSKAIDKIKNPCVKICDYLYLGNVYNGIRNQLYFKLAQIKNYDWLSQKMIDVCHKNMAKHVSKQLIYEDDLGYYCYNHNEFGKIEIKGVIDAVDDNIVWEFKCVDILSTDHLLQLVIYAWLWQKNLSKVHGDRQFKIMNIKTGEIRILKQKWHYIEQIMECLFQNKFGTDIAQTDKKFIKNCLDYSRNNIHCVSFFDIIHRINIYIKNKNFKAYLKFIGVDTNKLKIIYSNEFNHECKKLCKLLYADKQKIIIIQNLLQNNSNIIVI